MLQTNNKIIAEINIVPYVDIMLVLLVVFMVATPLLNQGVVVELPVADAQKIAVNNQPPILVTVSKENKLFLNISDDPYNAIAPEALQIRVAAALQLAPTRLVLVRGAKEVNYAKVLKAMVLLQQAGASSVGLETQPE
ncbi:MAG: protein TolR [Legionellales bacterium]|nr:MAG: protein TolR [Legionellales bacterium]